MRRRVTALGLAHPVAAALLIFAASRVIVWLGVVLADGVIAPNTGPGFWNVGEWWFHRLLRWDTGWYLRIATHGYGVDADRSVETAIVFFPLLPLAARALSTWTGLRIFDAMLLLGVVGGLASVGLLVALVRPLFGAATAIRSAALLAFLPSSVFLSAA